MTRFALRYPYFIIVLCLMVTVLGVTSIARMAVDLFPAIKIPVVVVATFFNGMPPEQIETDITGRFERFFTLGSGIEHMESRSLPGVSIIKGLFPARHRCRLRCDDNFQSRHGGSSEITARYLAPRGA